MSEQEKLELQDEIIKNLESDIKKIENTLEAMKEKLEYLKDIVWDRQSKKESSSMYKVLKEDKTHTMVKSELGDIKVDKDFMQKEIQKHLDNPALRGMVTTQEMLSFPKVAKNVEAEYEEKHKNYTWKVKANDKSVIAYGSREYVKDNKEINRLLTAHSKTESNQRLAEMDRRGRPYHSIFNDFNFRKSANSAINSHDSTKTNTLTTQGSNATSIADESITQINAHNDEMETISSKLDSAERMHENLQKDLAELNNQPKAQRNEARETDDDRDENIRRMR